MLKFSSPKIAILLFILLALILPFYESNRVIMWATQGGTQKENIFFSLVLYYAQASEKLKKNIGLDDFFKKEHSFWKEFKESPLIFQPVFVKELEKETITEEEPKEEAVKDEKEKIEKTPKPLPKIYSYYRFLIIGDSFIAVKGGVGEILETELLKYKDVFVKRFGQVSSGLSRPDYFNWEIKITELITQYHPNIAIVILSSNDAQSILTSNRVLVANYGDSNWNYEYSKRVSVLLDIFEKNNIIVFWIGFPIMKNQTFANRIKNLNSIYEEEAKKRENAYFFSTWELFADENGNYIASLPDEQGIFRSLRQSDGIHLTYFGGKLVVDKFIEKMKEVIKIELK